MIRTSAAPPSGTVTFLFTDIEGSTALWDQDRDAMGRAQRDHDEVLRRVLDAWGGYVFSVAGDGYGAAFPVASRAMGAALAIQRNLAAREWPEAAEIRVRMGLHSGEVEERDGNYFGPAVNHAARLAGVARGGQLVASSVVADLVGGRDDVDLVDLGLVTLSGLAAPVRLYGVSTDGRAWVDRPLAVAEDARGNLPVLRTTFVGSVDRIATLAARVRTSPLVTLTGPGGIGKSRLAVEVAWRVADEYPDGMWLTELAPVPAGGDPIDAIASTLSISPQPGMTTVDAVVDWCYGRRLLLVLDNCEHVLGPMAALAAAILRACPTVTVLATSQRSLGVAAEDLVALVGLDARDGVALFRDRAAVDGPGRRATVDAASSEREAVERLCERLDGVPLAIELAAARARVLSPHELLDRLDDRLGLLRRGPVDTAARHRTMRAAVEWSYDLLDDDQRQFYDALSVFAGGFDREAVRAVAQGEGAHTDELAVIDRLDDLVDTSLVTTTRRDGVTRYRVLETLRQYTGERLDARGGTAAARDRHLAHFLAVAEHTHDRWFGPDQPAADRVFEQEWDNLRVAHHWALSTGQPEAAQRLVVATAWHALERVRYEHRAWTADALACALDHDATHPTTFAALAAWAYFAAEPVRTVELARDGHRRHPDHLEVGGCLAWLLYGLLGADMVDEATEAVSMVAAQLDRAAPLDVEFMARMALADASLGDGPASGDDGFVDLCRRIASPVALARAAQFRANRRLSADPPDVPGALADYRRAIEVGGDDAPSERLWSLGGIATCLALVDDRQAPRALRTAIRESHGSRLWFELDLVLGTCASYLLGHAPRAAATILGHVRARPASAIGATTAARRAALAEVATWDHGHDWLEEGARMDRHAIVTCALDALDVLDASWGPSDVAAVDEADVAAPSGRPG